VTAPFTTRETFDRDGVDALQRRIATANDHAMVPVMPGLLRFLISLADITASPTPAK